ncbi:MAG: DUF4097 family beta strand repeat protein [Thermoanaerobaculia bacterium]|nr:DUF4097 family beta strand repeat protein [Thermoanaerobaculia bacterium]
MKRKVLPGSVLLLLALFPALAAAETRIERTLRLDPGGEFRLEASAGSVTVTGSSDTGAHIVVTSRRSDIERVFHLDFQERPGGVEVTARRKRRFLFDVGNYGSLHFEVRVPARTRLQIDTSGGSIRVTGTRGDADLETSGGSVHTTDLEGTLDVSTSGGSVGIDRQAGDVRATTSGGSVRVRDVKGRVELQSSGGNIEGDVVTGPVRARTSGGSVELREIAADVDAQTSGGSIQIAGAHGRVNAETSGGSIRADLSTGNEAGGTLETSGGGIIVKLDPQANLEIDASGGPVTVDLPVRVQGEISRRQVKGSLGSGGKTLRLHASGGSVRVEPRSR